MYLFIPYVRDELLRYFVIKNINVFVIVAVVPLWRYSIGTWYNIGFILIPLVFKVLYDLTLDLCPIHHNSYVLTLQRKLLHLF